MTDDVTFIAETSSLLYDNMPFKPGRAAPKGEVITDYFYKNLDIPRSRPFFSYQANGRIHDLEEIQHTDEEIAFLNKKGLAIFLYEPLCSYFLDDPDINHGLFNCGFYSEFSQDPDYYKGKLGAAELDSIQKYVDQNNLNNVNVYSGDYRIDEIYDSIYTGFGMWCHDVFLYGLHFYPDGVRRKTNITKKFISANWRYTPARCITSAILADKDTNLVWYFDTPYDILAETPWIRDSKTFSFTEQLKAGLDTLTNTGPAYLDMPTDIPCKITESSAHYYPDQIDEFKRIGNPVGKNNAYSPLAPYYLEAFVDVINESRYAQPTGNLSEKTMQAIQFKTPFILVAPPYSLHYVQDLGFETFHRWWDESYDKIEDPAERMEAIVKVINQIDSMSYDEIQVMYSEMRWVLEANLKQLAEMSPHGQLLKRDPAQVAEQDLVAVHWLARDDDRSYHTGHEDNE